MAYRLFIVGLSMIAATSAASAAQPEAPPPAEAAPPAPADARYCLRVDPLPGSKIERILCETREEWTMLEVDLDQEWAKQGVRVISPEGPNS